MGGRGRAAATTTARATATTTAKKKKKKKKKTATTTKKKGAPGEGGVSSAECNAEMKEQFKAQEAELQSLVSSYKGTMKSNEDTIAKLQARLATLESAAFVEQPKPLNFRAAFLPFGKGDA